MSRYEPGQSGEDINFDDPSEEVKEKEMRIITFMAKFPEETFTLREMVALFPEHWGIKDITSPVRNNLRRIGRVQTDKDKNVIRDRHGVPLPTPGALVKHTSVGPSRYALTSKGVEYYLRRT